MDHFCTCFPIKSFQYIKLLISTKFHAGFRLCSGMITISLLEAWNLVPQSINSTRGHFSDCVHILSFLAYQTAHPCQISCWYHNLKRIITISLLEAWNLVQQSKNSPRGHFSACLHIQSFSAYQAAHLYQILCWYHNLKRSYYNILIGGLEPSTPVYK